ncbi:MAG: type 4 pilus major pilin [Pseudomonadota bacterium]|nr:type 4 pilus major pilin [Pseudomonadota bacterium]
MRNLNLYAQQGRSMIEMLGVLAIIGVLSVGGIAGFSKAMDSYKTNEINEQISTIIANVRNVGLRQGGSYRGLTVAAAKKMKLIPPELINSSGNLVHAYGGAVEIGSSKQLYNSSLTNEKDFVVVYKSLLRAQCMQILSKGWGGPKMAVVAAGDNSPNSAKYLESHPSASECKTSGKVAVCYNKEMPIDTISKGCSCGKTPSCAIAIWVY